MQQIRNFSIIAHIDHGKSTLADRFLELTKTIEKRKMREQVLDSMELERERGITIKMQPVKMVWKNHVFNLIDTPGHIDFSYEVSRALSAVEGAILLVDATQGVQAQTLSVLRQAKELGLVIVPAVSKIDSPLAQTDDVKNQLAKLLEVSPDSVLLCSGRTGEGVDALLQAVIERVPPPKEGGKHAPPRALVFDFQYSDHQGVIVYLRIFGGSLKKGDALEFAANDRSFVALEVGSFSPAPSPAPAFEGGAIGYVVTGIKEPGLARVGDTVRGKNTKSAPLAGYAEPRPVVWASVYPESQDDFTKLRQSLSRLRLSDSSLSFEEESSGVLGRGFRCGFLGMLHLEIVVERLKRDFGVTTIVATPTVKYTVKTRKGILEIYSPHKFPEAGEIIDIEEPWLKVEILMPPEKLSSVMKLLQEHEAVLGETRKFSESRISLAVEMPLRELMRDFFDELKSSSQGYASMNYEFLENRPGDLLRLDLLVAEEIVPAFSKIVPRIKLEDEAFRSVEKLYKIIPQALFSLKIQARAGGRILASRTLKALRKDVTGYLYGGDRSRKMKLWKKQKEGKKRLQEEARFTIPADVFVKMIRK